MEISKKQHCLTDLRRRILSMEIRPGADLDEVTLSERYGVSRTPLREVLQRLAGEGFVTQTDNRGTKVASMDLATMRTFFQTAPSIYANVARLAAENRTGAQLDELKSVQAGFAKAVAGAAPAEMALGNHRFHELLGEMAANAYLTPSLNRLLIDHTRLAQVFYRPAAPAETVAVRKASEQHDAMIAALEVREGAVMVDLTLEHWALSRDRMERFVRPDPLPADVVDLSGAKIRAL
ncbi:MAG: GntR family transcriptional regulator [Pseudomonadota bacterium]